MKNLIEVTQKNGIICDNPKCDFKIENETKDPKMDCSEYLNVGCPNCGENLLTEKDYLDYQRLLKIINWMNKWFSWLTIFTPKSKYTKSTVKVHNGITFKQEK